MRSLHPTPNSRFEHKVERAAEGFNSLCLYLPLIAFFSWVLLAEKPAERVAVKRTASIEREVTEEQYLVAVSSAKTNAVKLTDEQVAEMDMWAAKATNPEDVKKLKPKAKAVYYASLNRGSVWEAVKN